MSTMQTLASFSLLYLPLPLLLSLSSLLFILHKKARSSRNSSRSQNLPPSPPKLPIIGNLHQTSDSPHRTLHHLSKTYGPIMLLQLGQIPTLVVSSAQLAMEILKTRDLEFLNRPVLVALNKISYNCSDIAASPHGQEWTLLRKLCSEQIFGPRKAKTFRRAREAEVEEMISSISTSTSAPLVNLGVLVRSLADNFIRRVVVGRRYRRDSTCSLLGYKVLEELQALLGAFFLEDYFPRFGWVDAVSGQRARLQRLYEELDGIYDEIIREHLATMSEVEDGREEEDFVDVLIRTTRECGCLTDDHVKGTLMDILVAGSDTTSATIEWTMAELMLNSRVMSKAQKEVRKVVGSKGKVEESDLPQLEYLKLIVKESFRSHPSAPLLLPRVTRKPCSVNGFDVPAGARVIVNAWAIGRDPGSWENPEEFLPERFEGSDVDYKGQDFELIPFGGGRRICPGMEFGVKTVELALANLLYAFDWELPTEKKGLDMNEAPGMAIHMKSLLQLKATKYRHFRGFN